MLAGHILLHLFSTFLFTLELHLWKKFSWKFITGSFLGLLLAPLPLLFITLLYGLEIGVAFIQAFVFVLLTCSYLQDAIKLHSD
jgi:F-type H+-transporting ATPase subunit a